jgi:Ca2+/H+ antiporter
MNKKANTALFILGATLYNILITILSFILLLIAYTRFIMRYLPEEAQAWSFPLIFIAAIVISFFVYRFTLKFLMKRIAAFMPQATMHDRRDSSHYGLRRPARIGSKYFSISILFISSLRANR